MFQKISNYFQENGKDEADINDLSNLVLLDAGTNRSFKNAFFPLKRKKIIERENEGVLIPICTKNVFLKYYSLQPPIQMTYWSINDKQAYLNNIKKTLEKYK